MKNIYSPKTEEIKELKQNLIETEAEQRIVDSYNSELDSYSGISSPKVYGPMYRASAESSVNERFTLLNIPCLEIGCGDKEAKNWHHANCGGIFQVSNRACLKCSGCSLSGDVRNFSFKCSNHSGNYWSTNQVDINALKRALFAALSQGVMEESLTLELIQCLNSNH